MIVTILLEKPVKHMVHLVKYGPNLYSNTLLLEFSLSWSCKVSCIIGTCSLASNILVPLPHWLVVLHHNRFMETNPTVSSPISDIMFWTMYQLLHHRVVQLPLLLPKNRCQAVSYFYPLETLAALLPAEITLQIYSQNEGTFSRMNDFPKM